MKIVEKYAGRVWKRLTLYWRDTGIWEEHYDLKRYFNV